MENSYREDLAYIHDTGYGDFARNAAPALLELIRHSGAERGLVIDLGCGSGIWAHVLSQAGYGILGFDISKAMIQTSRKRVPGGEFRQQSYLTAELPPCVAVTAIGECFNYLFDSNNSDSELIKLFRRIHNALCPGGLLIFDVAVPGRVVGAGSQRSFREGEDWAVLVTAAEDAAKRLLTREITSFRKVGNLYRRDNEMHHLRLADRAELAKQLRRIGFRVRTLRGYGAFRFPRGWVGLLARKSET